MKKNAKKVVATMAACAMIGAMAVGGTFAYLTDSETTTNTFTVGKVQVDLTEPNKPDENTPRVPNEEIAKDPTVKNTGDNDAIMFVAFDIPMDNLVVADSTGAKKEAADVELFDFRADTKTYDSVNDGWVQVSATKATDNSKMTYIYGYDKTVAKTDDVPSVFDHVRMANIVEGQIDQSKLNMPIRAYAIQAGWLQSEANTTENHDIVTTGTMTKETLTTIYNIFAAQNPNAVKNDKAETATFTIDDANTNGALDLSGANR